MYSRKAVITILMVPQLLFGKVINCNKHKIYCQIKNNKKSIDKVYAMKLSNIIYRISKKISIKSHILTGILMQENQYRNKDRRVWAEVNGKPTLVPTDIGIAQLNIKTIHDYGFNPDRVRADLEYAITVSAVILKDKITKCEKFYNLGFNKSWGCYHSFTPEYRDEYLKLVRRYL